MAYLQGKGPVLEGCLFCTALQTEDAQAHIVYRGDLCYAILNRFPYNNGHLMVVPHIHASTLEALDVYRLIVDIWLVGILPVTLYPFLGGKIWCRYWCPLAKIMDLLSSLYVRLGISRCHIVANDRCISCNEC